MHNVCADFYILGKNVAGCFCMRLKVKCIDGKVPRRLACAERLRAGPSNPSVIRVSNRQFQCNLYFYTKQFVILPLDDVIRVIELAPFCFVIIQILLDLTMD